MCLLKDELMITRLDDNISYIEPTVNPLSANVVIINGKDAVWLYDVGSHPDIPDMLYDYITKSKVTVDDEVSLQKKKINIVLSTYYKGTALEGLTKKLEEYLDEADKEENTINYL